LLREFTTCSATGRRRTPRGCVFLFSLLPSSPENRGGTFLFSKELIADEFPMEEAGWGRRRCYLLLSACSLLCYALTMTNKIHFARMLRARSTDAERALWGRVRARQLAGVKFRRQFPIGPYIVDFISFDVRIAIELDGGQHAASPQQEHDAKRDRWLEEEGFVVLRFWNTDVLMNIEGVLSTILDKVQQRRSC